MRTGAIIPLARWLLQCQQAAHLDVRQGQRNAQSQGFQRLADADAHHGSVFSRSETLSVENARHSHDRQVPPTMGSTRYEFFRCSYWCRCELIVSGRPCCILSGALWVCVVLNPHCNPSDKLHWRQMLERWSQVDVCPPEDPDFRLVNVALILDITSSKISFSILRFLLHHFFFVILIFHFHFLFTFLT